MLKYFLLLFSILFLLTGCLQNNLDNQSNPNNVYNNSLNDQNLSNQQVADHLADIATRIPEVQQATAVVAGKYAVVGIKIDPKMDRSRVGTIKYTVAHALKKDPYGANAVVTSNPDIITRLKRMNAAIENGKPIKGIADQLAEIVGHIMPEVPQDIQAPKGPNIIKQNRNQLDQKSKKQKLQNEQQQQKQTK